MLYSVTERLLRRLLARALSGGQTTATDSHIQIPRQSGDLYVGEAVTDHTPVILTAPQRRRHLWIAGSTGCGKTNLLLRLIDADVEAGSSVVVLDKHGDLTDRLLTRLASRPGLDPHRVCLLDLRSREVVGFSPFNCPGDAHGKAFYALSVLKRQASSWGIDLEQTLRNCLMALAEAGESLVGIEPLLTDAAYRHRVLERVTDPFVIGFFERYDALRPEAQRSLTAPVLNKISGLTAIPRVRAMLGSTKPLPVEEILNRPGQIIIVCLASSALHDTANLIGAMFVGVTTMIALARSAIPERDRQPTVLYVDECESLLTDAYGVILAEGRKFGLAVTLANQNLSQLPTDLREVILANTGVQFFFQTSSADASHLAAELVSNESREQLRKNIVSQPVGMAYLSRRGEEAVQVRTALSPDPPANASAIALIRSLSAQRYSVGSTQATGLKPPAIKEEVSHERRPIL